MVAIGDSNEPFLTGGGDAGARMRAEDWSRSPLGPPALWPQPLKTIVSVLLSAKQPMFLAWGEERTLLYNDGYSEILGDKHPAALGRPFLEVWDEARSDLLPIVESAYAGNPVHMDDIALHLNRHGRLEEAHFAFSYTPIQLESGAVAGFFCPCTETTAQILAKRQLAAETERQRRLFDQAPGFITILGGPDHVFEFVNRTYVRLFGNRDFVGSSVRDVFPELEGQGFFELLDRVYATGERFVAHHVPIRLQAEGTASEEHFLDFIYEPVLDDAGRVTGIFCEGHDVTVEKEAREKLSAHTRRQDFRLLIEEQLRDLPDPVAMMTGATAALGSHLGLAQVGFGEVDSSGDHVAIEREWNDGRGVSVVGTWRMADFGADFIRAMKDGATAAIPDVREDPRTNAPEVLAAYEAIGTRAMLDVPLVRNGRLVAMMFVHHPEPRHWTADEIATVEETSGRLWSALERARAERRLRESEERARRIVEGVKDYSVFTTDTGGVIADWTPGAQEIFGWSADEIVGRNSELLFTPEDRAADVPAQELATARDHGCANDERWHLRRDGSRFFANGSVRPLHDGQGEIAGFIKIARDETERRAVETRLQASEEFNRRVLASSADCIKVLNLEGRLEFMSEGGMCVMEVEDFGAIDGACWADFWTGEGHSQALAAIAEAKSGRTGRFQGFATTFKGTPRWWDVIVTPINGPDGQPERLLSISRDVTATKQAEIELHELNETLEERVAERSAELLQAEEALRQSQKMEAVGQLTGGLAHDFNNLLAGISGSLEMMGIRMDQGRHTDVDKYMVAAKGAARRAASLTHRLLAFSRRQTLDPKPTDVNRLIGGMEELIRRTAGPMTEIEVVGAVGLWPALVDPSQLENALLNLCINARDAMPEGGRITIETANKWLDREAAKAHDMPEGQYLSLCVTDTGTGMGPEVIAKAFDPFFTTKPIGEGTGLGLSMIYGFAKQSGGQVRIYSEVGQGSTVCIYLPRHHSDLETEAVSEDSVELPRAEQGETVLVVDDEPTVRMLVADVLEELGYTAIEAGDSAAGLKILESDARIDLLVSDVGLPGGMNGRQMADAGRLARPDLKVLFITGYAENAAIGNGHLAPGMAVMTKPFAVDALAARIREMIQDRT